MSRDKIKKVKRIRSIEERNKDLTVMKIGRLDGTLRMLANEAVEINEHFEKANREVDGKTASLPMLTSVFHTGVQRDLQIQENEQAKSDIKNMRTVLVEQLRQQQIRIDQWDKLLEKLEMDVAAEEARKASIAADESFLASHLRGKA